MALYTMTKFCLQDWKMYLLVEIDHPATENSILCFHVPSFLRIFDLFLLYPMLKQIYFKPTNSFVQSLWRGYNWKKGCNTMITICIYVTWIWFKKKWCRGKMMALYLNRVPVAQQSVELICVFQYWYHRRLSWKTHDPNCLRNSLK